MQTKKIAEFPVQNNLNHLSDLHLLLQRIYQNRGISTKKETENRLYHLNSFEGLKDVKLAAKRINAALLKEEKILIIGDWDVDGATATALMIRGLKIFGAKNLDFYIPNRFKDNFGFSVKMVNEALASKVGLIITVDNGISSHEAVENANSLGIDVIITDHHRTDEKIPQAFAVINPNRMDDEFPSKNLCGTGVAFYLLLALRALLRDLETYKEFVEPDLTTLLDLVALATIADLVNLDHTNRILVQRGLQNIRSGNCSLALKKILKATNRHYRKVKSSDLSHVIAPRLNAAGRLDDMKLSAKILMSDNKEEIDMLAKKLEELNKQRKTIEDRMYIEARDFVNKNYDANNLAFGIILFSPDYHLGVIGLTAAKIKEKFSRPTIVFAKDRDKDFLKGSGRSIKSLDLYQILYEIDSLNPDLIASFGGHKMAIGIRIREYNYHKFSQIFDETLRQKLTEDDLFETIYTDGELENCYISLNIIKLLNENVPFGQNFPEPLFDNEFEILKQKIVGKRHLKLLLLKEGRRFTGLYFNIEVTEWPNKNYRYARIIYQLDINNYLGCEDIQLIINHIEPIVIN